MKRDMDVIRSIILAVREADEPMNGMEDLDTSNFAFHVQLMDEAGLIQCSLAKNHEGIAEMAVIYRLTWDGHDFADSIADETVWNKAKQHLLGSSASWSFSILKDVVTATIKDGLNLG